MKILVIDDEKYIREILAEYLAGMGHEVFSAGDGAEGLELAKDHPDLSLVITDIRLPGIQGDAVAASIRKAGGVHTVIVGITGSPDEYDGKVFDSLLEKPFGLTELSDIVESVPV